jgi:acetyl esterase
VRRCPRWRLWNAEIAAFADLRGLPPALLSVGTCDHLLDDTLLFASRSAAAGNETELFVAPDLPHAFGFIPCAITAQWQQRSESWLEKILAGQAR